MSKFIPMIVLVSGSLTVLPGCSEQPPEEKLEDAAAELEQTTEATRQARDQLQQTQDELDAQARETRETLEQTGEELRAKVDQEIEEAKSEIQQATRSIDEQIDTLLTRAEQALTEKDWDAAASAVDRLRALDLEGTQSDRIDRIEKSIADARSAQSSIEEAEATLREADQAQ